MKMLCTANNSHELKLLQGLLESEGIKTSIANESLSNLLGPYMPSAQPELWIVHNENFDRARQIYEDFGSGK